MDDRYKAATSDHDVGLIQLATPLWTTPIPPPTTAPISIIDDGVFQGYLSNLAIHPITTTVSGWGYDQPVDPASSAPPNQTGFPDVLQAADVPLIDQATCANDFSNPPNNTQISGLTLFCAGADSDTANLANKDSCNGDSGGPLVIDPAKNTIDDTTVKLAGLVDSGFGCAWHLLPGIYTRVSALTDFIDATDPRPAAPPTVLGIRQVGQVLTCNPGAWTGSPNFMYRFYRETGSGPQPITGLSGTATYTAASSDANANLFCEVQASAGNTDRTADSASVTIPGATQPPAGVVDSTAPTLRVVSKSCTKASCTVKVRVADAAPSSGIGGVKTVLRWSKKVKCKSQRSGAAKTCTKRMRRTLSAKAGTKGRFTIVAKHLTPGTGYTLSITPFDRAGNKPQFSTITNVRTKPRHRTGLLT
jgi:hypothetical protein